MREQPDRPKAQSASEMIDGMGLERRALVAKRLAVVMLQLCAWVCLLAAVASLTGYLPHATGPSLLLVSAAVVGFVLSAVEARRP